MKSKLSTFLPKGFTNALIGCTLLTFLIPISVKAELTDAEYLTTFGTSRRMQTCPSRSEPTTGRLTVAQAIKYARCDVEENGYKLNFVDFSQFQLSAPRQATVREEVAYGLDRNQPVYAIKAYAVRYHCFAIKGSFLSQPGNNCTLDGTEIKDKFNSDGLCFKRSTERWFCRIFIPISRKIIQGPPPTK